MNKEGKANVVIFIGSFGYGGPRRTFQNLLIFNSTPQEILWPTMPATEVLTFY